VAMNRRPKRAVRHTDRPGSGTIASRQAVPERRDPEQRDRALTSSTDPLGPLIGATYEVAMRTLGEVAPASSYQALARLSGHLAAMQRAVYPVAGRRLGEGKQLLAACLAEAREAEWALRLLECRLAGEASTASRDLQVVHTWLAQCLDAYQSAEMSLLMQLEERLTVTELEQLALGYCAALARAPTRPHPGGPRTGWPGRIAFALHAFWDRVLDTVDCRPGVGRVR